MNTENTTVAVATESKSKGRPVVANSVRQMKLAAQAERIANGGSIKRGRPTASTSKRQERLAERATLLASGVTIKPGRPKKVAEGVSA